MYSTAGRGAEVKLNIRAMPRNGLQNGTGDSFLLRSGDCSQGREIHRAVMERLSI